jgi:ArsR family transcriptional regulator
MNEINYVAFAKALADDTRQEIMSHLCCVWLSVSDVVEKLEGKSQPTVSHHLKILEDAGLVEVRKEGKYRYYTLNQAHMTTCCGGLVATFAPDYVANVVPVAEIDTK